MPINTGIKHAMISPCGTYRYYLTRQWGSEPAFPRQLNVIGLNPSTADGMVDDATIRRCVKFAQGIDGVGMLQMLNLFALRSRNPILLLQHPDPTGPDNAKYLENMFHNQSMANVMGSQYHITVVAWGANRAIPRTAVQQFLQLARGNRLYCWGRNQDGSPKHPLYLPADAELQEWQP